MSDAKQSQRLATLKAEFQILLEFHAKSFVEIDGKAKYWLTLTLPSFIALMGYLLKEGKTLPLELLIPACTLATCLFFSTIFYSRALMSRPVESGMLSPKSREISGIFWYLKNDEQWTELLPDQIAEILRSIANNEKQNQLKAVQLKWGEISLLLGAPIGLCLSAGSAFLYSATCPNGLTISTGICAGGTTTWATVAGIAIAFLTCTVLIIANHFVTKR